MYTVDPPRRQLSNAGLETAYADSVTGRTSYSFDEVRQVAAMLGSRKKDGDCNISAELLKAGREAMIH